MVNIMSAIVRAIAHIAYGEESKVNDSEDSAPMQGGQSVENLTGHPAATLPGFAAAAAGILRDRRQ